MVHVVEGDGADKVLPADETGFEVIAAPVAGRGRPGALVTGGEVQRTASATTRGVCIPDRAMNPMRDCLRVGLQNASRSAWALEILSNACTPSVYPLTKTTAVVCP